MAVPFCDGVPPSTVTRRRMPVGKCAGSVQVHVIAVPLVVGVACETAFCARQYAPTFTIESIHTSPSDFACATLSVMVAIGMGAYQLLAVGVSVWTSMITQRPAVCALSICALNWSAVSLSTAP